MLQSHLVLPMEAWCASPKGCYKDGTGPATAPATNATETNPLQEIINNSIDYFVSASAGKLVEILLYVVIAIVVLVVVKKLMVAGVSKAQSMDIGSKISNAGKAYADEKSRIHNEQVKAIAKAKKLRQGVNSAIANDEYGHAFNALEEVLEKGKSFYEEEIAKQDEIQLNSEQSLASNLVSQMQSVDMGAPDLSLKSLRTYDDTTKLMFTTKPVDELFAEFNNIDEGMNLSYSDMEEVAAEIPEWVAKTRKAHQKLQDRMNELTDEDGEALPLPPSYRNNQ